MGQFLYGAAPTYRNCDSRISPGSPFMGPVAGFGNIYLQTSAVIAMAIAGCGPRRVHGHRRWLARVVAVYREPRISCSMPHSSTFWWPSQRRRLYARPRCHCTIKMLIRLSLVSRSASGRQCARERHRKGKANSSRESSKGKLLHSQNLCSVTRQGRRQ